MLDIKYIREKTDEVRRSLARRDSMFSNYLECILELDSDRRDFLKESEGLKYKKNIISSKVGKLKKQGHDATQEMDEVKSINLIIKELDQKVQTLDNEINGKLLLIPNLPDNSVPQGEDDSSNQELKKWGELPQFDFIPKNHVQLGEALDILDFKRATKITGARFTVYKGAGARLLRALIDFMLDLQTQDNNYLEIYPPFLVNKESMIGTGQLPKFEEDLFKLKDDPYYLIPTAEVPVTNFHREEILAGESLPLRYAAYTPCFRREAGSYGKDTQGLIRQHQFDKVELVKFVSPESSAEELDSLIKDAESILQKLGLHYRVVVLCSGDLGFSASKTCDLEVWLPGQNTFREISSCSNFTDYQARRAKIRYKTDAKTKPDFVHTLNGSGLAAGRLFVAILENFQQSDGSIKVPLVLQSYMNGLETIAT